MRTLIICLAIAVFGCCHISEDSHFASASGPHFNKERQKLLPVVNKYIRGVSIFEDPEDALNYLYANVSDPSSWMRTFVTMLQVADSFSEEFNNQHHRAEDREMAELFTNAAKTCFCTIQRLLRQPAEALILTTQSSVIEDSEKSKILSRGEFSAQMSSLSSLHLLSDPTWFKFWNASLDLVERKRRNISRKTPSVQKPADEAVTNLLLSAYGARSCYGSSILADCKIRKKHCSRLWLRLSKPPSPLESWAMASVLSECNSMAMVAAMHAADDLEQSIERSTIRSQSRRSIKGGKIQGSCRENSEIVTAASSGYFMRVVNLAGSVRQFAGEIPFSIYDIGLDKDQQAVLIKNGFAVRSLGSSQQSGDMHGSRGHGWQDSSYAFKPKIMLEALQRSKCVLWVDSSFEVRRPLHGIFSFLDSPDRPLLTMTSRWPFPNAFSHPASLMHPVLALNSSGYFQFEAPFINISNIGFAHTRSESYTRITARPDGLPELEAATGVVAVRNEPTVMRLIQRWVACSKDMRCIAPSGSSKLNHRQDQTAWAALLVSKEFKALLRKGMAASSHLYSTPTDEYDGDDIDPSVPSNLACLVLRRMQKPFRFADRMLGINASIWDADVA